MKPVALAIVLGGVLSLSSASAEPLRADEFPRHILALHNTARILVGAPPLSWDPVLAQGAAAWAVTMARTGKFTHSDRSTRPGIGENLWMGTRGAYSVDSMVGGWIGERRNFLAGIFPNVSRTGNWFDVSHYTQLIWPTSGKVGCALARGRSDYLVCRYSPKGNQNGRWVGPARSERG